MSIIKKFRHKGLKSQKLDNIISQNKNKGNKMFLSSATLGTMIYQTTYFLLFAQLLCFGCLFGIHTKLRDIFLCLCLIFAQLILLDFGYSRSSTPTLNTSNYICFAFSISGFIYMMRLLYIVAKAKNRAEKTSEKDFIKDFKGIAIIIALLFVVVVAKMVYDFV